MKKNKNRNKPNKFVAMLLCGAMACTMLSGCSAQAQALTSDVEPVVIEDSVITQEHTDMLADFSYSMLRHFAAEQEENILISPLSAWLVLTMTGQGANGDTADEFAWFSRQLDAAGQRELAAWLIEYLTQYDTVEETGAEIDIANSVWCDDALTVNDSFVDIAKAYYRAEIIQQDLQAPGAVKTVNDWISTATKERIQNMLDQIDKNAVMLLINALTLDAKWQDAFDIANTAEDLFYLPDGTDLEKEFMHKRLTNASYLHWDGGEGIVLPYQENSLSMIALMPDEAHSCEDMIKQLHSVWLRELQDNRTLATVNLSMPKFKMESSITLNNICQAMGLETAFDQHNADFTGIGTADNGTNIFIGRVLQNCMLEVGEEGTKAAAATVVEMRCGSARPDPSMLVELQLNRPFVYLIVDNQTQIPLFTGIYQGE